MKKIDYFYLKGCPHCKKAFVLKEINRTFIKNEKVLPFDKHNAKLYFVDGFCKDEIMVKIMSYPTLLQIWLII